MKKILAILFFATSSAFAIDASDIVAMEAQQDVKGTALAAGPLLSPETRSGGMSYE